MKLPKGQPTSEGIYSCLPIFPLQEVHLFPETLLPLHIFEPRYRQMIQDSLKAESLIGIILPDLKEDPKAYEPALLKMGGVGKIQYHELLEDGRYNIILQGIEKFELLEELKLSDILYRAVRARALKDSTTISHSDEKLIRQELLSAFSLTFSPFYPDKILSISDDISLEKFVNLVASSLKISAHLKQELFEMDNIEDRSIQILRVLYESTNPQRFYRRIRQSKPSTGNMN
ncbi:MAG: LON peptidase substrate-binding domain-containing protein [Planctomycetota bacterium]